MSDEQFKELMKNLDEIQGMLTPVFFLSFAGSCFLIGTFIYGILKLLFRAFA